MPAWRSPKSPTAAVIGGGLSFGQETAVSIEGRYIYGLQDLELETVTNEESFKERSFMILAGISF